VKERKSRGRPDLNLRHLSCRASELTDYGNLNIIIIAIMAAHVPSRRLGLSLFVKPNSAWETIDLLQCNPLIP
jgi:hypothetical protein